MRSKLLAAALAVTAATLLLAVPADAAAKKKRVVVSANRQHTVFVSRDEDGKTHTRIIIQKRSYLDPGTETFPGENTGNGYAWSPNHRADGVLDNTIFGSNETALPGPFTLPLKSNPWIGD